MLTEAHYAAAAHAYNDAMERWRYHDNAGQFIVVELPSSVTTEPMQTINCWHFPNKFGAKRFRDTKVLSTVIEKLIEIGAVKAADPAS